MKKLMIAAAIVCAAAFAQAASYEWTAQGVYSGWSTSYSDVDAEGVAYLFADTGTTLRDTVFAAVVAGTFESGGWADKAIGSGSEFTGMISDVANNGATGTDFVGENMYAVILSKIARNYDDPWEVLDTSDKYYAFVTETAGPAGAQQEIGSPQIDFGDISEKAGSSGNWYVQGVPEPTSGLLLLLGVAGLALRRRRA